MYRSRPCSLLQCSVHHPGVAVNAVTVLLMHLWILVLGVFLVLGEDEVLNMGMKWNLWVENFVRYPIESRSALASGSLPFTCSAFLESTASKTAVV